LNGFGHRLVKVSNEGQDALPQVLNDVKFPRYSNRRTKMLNQSSIWFKPTGYVSVLQKRMRWLSSLKN